VSHREARARDLTRHPLSQLLCISRSVFGLGSTRPHRDGDRDGDVAQAALPGAGARSSGGQSAALIRPRSLVRVQARPLTWARLGLLVSDRRRESGP
jgi:hypothetical protein